MFEIADEGVHDLELPGDRSSGGELDGLADPGRQRCNRLRKYHVIRESAFVFFAWDHNARASRHSDDGGSG